jgi:hypothetical protein
MQYIALSTRLCFCSFRSLLHASREFNAVAPFSDGHVVPQRPQSLSFVETCLTNPPPHRHYRGRRRCIVSTEENSAELNHLLQYHNVAGDPKRWARVNIRTCARRNVIIHQVGRFPLRLAVSRNQLREFKISISGFHLPKRLAISKRDRAQPISVDE